MVLKRPKTWNVIYFADVFSVRSFVRVCLDLFYNVFNLFCTLQLEKWKMGFSEGFGTG